MSASWFVSEMSVKRVPQGSVLGPLLFLLFVNDLPRWIVNSMKMFADDTKLWCRIETESDSESLQKDLDSLATEVDVRIQFLQM